MIAEPQIDVKEFLCRDFSGSLVKKANKLFKSNFQNAFRNNSVKLLLVFLLSFGLACSGLSQSLNAKNEEIVCTVYPLYVVSRELLKGTDHRVGLIVSEDYGCPHHYSLSPGNLRGLQNAKALVINGLGFEPFTGKLMQEFPHLKLIEANLNASCLPSLDSPQVPNPHVFSYPNGLKLIIENISNGLIELYKSEENVISKNRSRIETPLSEAEKAWEAAALEMASTPVFITHDSLSYAARALKLRIIGKLEFESENEGEPSAGEILKKIDEARKEGVRVILVDDQEKGKIAATVSRETGIPIVFWNVFAAKKPGASDDPAQIFIENIRVLRKTMGLPPKE